MYLLFCSIRPVNSEAGTGDHDHASSVGQPVQARRGQQGDAEQMGLLPP